MKLNKVYDRNTNKLWVKIIKTELINVCIQGLGYVGAATIAAVARAKNNKGNPIYNITGLDINNKTGRQRIDSINRGYFPFKTQDQELLKSIKNAHKSFPTLLNWN